MRVRKTNENGQKIAFITSTKIWKRAVDRNLVKRRLRAIFQTLVKDVPPGIHLLFIVKPDASKAKHPALVEEMTRLVGKIPETLAKPASLSPRAKKIQEKRKAKTGR
jgi:ribonuclease P protein component